MKHKRYFATVLLPLALAACSVTDEAQTPTTTGAVVTEAPAAAKYTQAMCDQLKSGLSRDQVNAIFGDPGHVNSHMDGSQYSKAFDIVEWSDKTNGFSSINATFEDGVLTNFTCYV